MAENIRLMGRTGWSIKVLAPSTRRAPRELFHQDVQAAPIVVDVAFAVVGAIQRGERLWDDEN